MTYLGFHLAFILPALALVTVLAVVRRALTRRDLAWVGAMALIAVIYTTPWDNYLVASGVWTYGSDRVIGTIGWVPIEEYLFFILQPFLTGIWFYVLLGRSGSDTPDAPGELVQSARWYGVAAGAILMVVGAFALTSDAGRYLGLILVWAAPVLILQWAVGAPYLWFRRWPVLLGIAVPTVYLWVCDRIAIGLGVWEISTRYTTGVAPLGLPIEEAVFFLATNVMVVQGLALVRVPFATHVQWRGGVPTTTAQPSA